MGDFMSRLRKDNEPWTGPPMVVGEQYVIKPDRQASYTDVPNGMALTCKVANTWTVFGIFSWFDQSSNKTREKWVNWYHVNAAH